MATTSMRHCTGRIRAPSAEKLLVSLRLWRLSSSSTNIRRTLSTTTTIGPSGNQSVVSAAQRPILLYSCTSSRRGYVQLMGRQKHPKRSRDLLTTFQSFPRHHTSSSAKSNHNSRNHHGQDDTLIANWLRMSNEIVSLKSPLKRLHWGRADELLKAVRHQPELSHLVDNGFLILDRLADEYERQLKSGGDRIPPQSLATLYAVLTTWRDNMLLDKPTLAHTKGAVSDTRVNDIAAVLARVERYMRCGLFHDDHVRTYNMILHVLSKQHFKGLSTGTAAQELAEGRIFEPMLRRSKCNPRNVQHHPNCETVYHVIGVLGRTGLMDAPENADKHLASLLAWYRQTGADDYRPTGQLFCAVMEAHSRCNRQTHLVPGRIHELFQQLKTFWAEGRDEDFDIATCYNRTCASLSESKDPQACDMARSILDEMCHEYFTNKNKDLKPTQQTFGSVLTAYVRAKRPREAEALFQYMKQLADEYGDESFLPGTMCYNDLILAYATVGDAEQADRTWSRMLATIEEGRQEDLMVNVQTLSAVMAAWAVSGRPDAVAHVERLMKQAKEMEKAADFIGEVNTATYNRLLTAYSQQGTVEAAQSAEALFEWMVNTNDPKLRPDSDSCLSVITAWSRVGLPEKCDSFLRRVVRATNVALLDKAHFGVAIEAWTASGNRRAAENAQQLFDLMFQFRLTPDVVGFSSLMWAWARSPNTEAAQHVERLFQHMCQMWKEGDDLLQPNHVTVHAVLYAMLQSKDPSVIDRASDLFRNMRRDYGVRRNAKMYNTIMSFFAKRKQTRDVEGLFSQMTREFTDGEEAVRPNFISYKTRLHGYSLAGDPDGASAIVREMVEQHEKGNLDQLPSTFQFNAVLRAWLRSKRPQAAQKAESGLRMMMRYYETGQFDCRPDTHSFNTVLVAYSNSNLPEAGEKSMSLLQELMEMEIPANFHTYFEVMLSVIRSGDVRGAEWLKQLIGELRQKDAHFWSAPEVDKTFRRVLSALERSSNPSNHALVDEVVLLWDRAAIATDRIHRNVAR